MTLTGRPAIAALVVLALSLMVNCVLIGFLVARSTERPRPAPAERISVVGTRLLPPPLRAEVSDRLKSDAPSLKAAVASVRQARQALVAAMRAEPYDRAAVAAALATLRQRIDALSELGDAAILDTLDDAAPELRAKIGPQPRRGD